MNIITVISRNTPMGDELQWLLKERGGHIFESCNISLKNTPTSHTVSLALVICACSDSASYASFVMHLLMQQQQIVPSFVSPSSCTVLFLCCFLLNITACTAAQLSGHTFERRAPFATTSFKKGGGSIFEGGLIFGRLQ